MGSSSSESEESVTDYSIFKESVLSRINNVHSAGSFSTFGHLESFTHLGIYVDEVGTVRIPLSSDDAQSLIRVSRQAPFGKGSQTLVDETVRKTWEIDGTKVSFLNKAWQGCVEGIIRTVAKDLGVPGGSGSVKAELYKTLLYEEGAMFKPHKEYVSNGLVLLAIDGADSVKHRKDPGHVWNSRYLPSFGAQRWGSTSNARSRGKDLRYRWVFCF